MHCAGILSRTANTYPETIMSIAFCILIMLTIGSAVAVLFAAEPKSDSSSGIDPAVAESMQPGPEHRQLTTLVGRWNVTCSMWMSPTAPVMQSNGSANFQPILNGRFLQMDFKGTFQGQVFTGLGMMGYDRAAKRYISTWCDSISTSFLFLQGTCSDAGRTITYTGDMVCPQLGHTAVRQVETHENADRFTLVMYQTPDGGKEFKSMELTYQRQ